MPLMWLIQATVPANVRSMEAFYFFDNGDRSGPKEYISLLQFHFHLESDSMVNI
jgi:hypothetical protein